MHAVTVLFRLKEGRYPAFVTEIRRNARLSLENEPGCTRFDVCVDEAAGEVFLYELYRDEAAFADHKMMPHYLEFQERAGDLVADKTVRCFTLDEG